jgi:hypothetical protein
MRQFLLLLAAIAGAQGLAGVARNEGTDAGSGIAYVLISMDGRLVGANAASGAAAPRLTAQCTKSPDGKLRFELLADFGGVGSVSFVPPWKPKPGEDFPPRVATPQVTMEFLGYTKVKPVKREWDEILEIPGEWKYATPGMSRETWSR